MTQVIVDRVSGVDESLSGGRGIGMIAHLFGKGTAGDRNKLTETRHCGVLVLNV